jgi:hypothetical protein
MFSEAVLEAVAVIVTSVAEFSVIEECDEVNVIDGGVTTTAAEEPRPHPTMIEVIKHNITNLIISMV